jgi:hypothetical protein
MNESIAERVARDFVTKWPSLDATDDEVVADLAPRIQAAIDEAVLHNFTTGELVEVAVRAARERFSKECERFHNEGKECATCGRKENFTQREFDEAVLAEREAIRPLLEAGQMLRNAEMLSIEDIEEAEKKWDAAYIAAAIRARNVGAPTSTTQV